MADLHRTTPRARADRILDAARELLLRWGYRRVTIEDIAKHAEVGKGTVYLHWRSREQLFSGVAAREAAGMMDAVVAAARADPAEVTLHRFLRRHFLEAMRRPVLRALFTRDVETLDKLLTSPAKRPLDSAELLAVREYLDVLSETALLRHGLRAEDLDYWLPAIAFGFFGIEPLLPPEIDLSLEAKADQLAETLRRTFEPPMPPTPAQLAAAAPPAIEIFRRLASDYRAAAYGRTKDQTEDIRNGS